MSNIALTRYLSIYKQIKESAYRLCHTAVIHHTISVVLQSAN